jgi:hypothetical protein
MIPIPSGIFGFPTPHCYETPLIAIAVPAAGTETFPLPLDRAPDAVSLRLVCQVAEDDWVPGDEVGAEVATATDGAGNWFGAFGWGYAGRGNGVSPGGLTLHITTYTSALYFISRYTLGGAPAVLTAASWKLKAVCTWFHP